MPVFYPNYSPSLLLRNPHVHTVYASLARSKLETPKFSSERIHTPDDDFLDVDWYTQDSPCLLVISHGLEGHTQRPYVRGMAKAAYDDAWDVLAWNYRSCSGETNRKLQSYHSGCTHDLHFLVNEAVARGYERIALCGFSIGGNKSLLYLGRDKALVPDEVVGAITYSVPCDLVKSADVLAKRSNRIYMRNFLKTLELKLKQKQGRYPEDISLNQFKKIKTFGQFDERYTAPLNGFASALDYWEQSSSLPHIDKIDRPTALFTSLDDPFLSESCYPVDVAKRNPNFHLYLTRFGGHVGFAQSNRRKMYWSESKGLEFLSQFKC